MESDHIQTRLSYHSSCKTPHVSIWAQPDTVSIFICHGDTVVNFYSTVICVIRIVVQVKQQEKRYNKERYIDFPNTACHVK